MACCVFDFGTTYQLVSLVDDLIKFIRIAFIKAGTEVEHYLILHFCPEKSIFVLLHSDNTYSLI
jgi:hypothetical protein